jgi:hypothetical protein
MKSSLMAIAGMALLLVACSGGDNSTSPAGSVEMTVTSAAVIVDGQTVNGMTLQNGHGGAAGTRFEARVEMPSGPVAGAEMWLRYERPGGMGGMMGGSGVVALYDDGTHGDGVPGDGIYCLDDVRGDYGCHGAGAPMGQYHYEFWGTHPHGETNHMRVTVTVTAP